MPPPEKVLAEPEVRLIVPVPVMVRFDPLAVKPPTPASVQVPEPTAIVLMSEPPELNLAFAPDNVKLNDDALNVPDVTVNTEKLL